MAAHRKTNISKLGNSLLRGMGPTVGWWGGQGRRPPPPPQILTLWCRLIGFSHHHWGGVSVSCTLPLTSLGTSQSWTAPFLRSLSPSSEASSSKVMGSRSWRIFQSFFPERTVPQSSYQGALLLVLLLPFFFFWTPDNSIKFPLMKIISGPCLIVRWVVLSLFFKVFPFALVL